MIRKPIRRCDLLNSLSTQPPPKMTTLCFLDAYHAHRSGEISWDEYLRHLLVHLTGVKHKEDSIDGMYPAVRRADSFGYGIFCWNLLMEQKVTGK